MNPTTGGGAYHPKPPHSEGSARDAKGASDSVVIHRSALFWDRKVAPISNVAPSAAPTAAPSREAAPSKLLTEWAKAPKPRSLVEGMQLAAKIDRITGPFSVFVQAACPSLSGKDFAKAVKNIALLAPPDSLDTNEKATGYMETFLPGPDDWKNDGLTPKARADHLMGVLARYELNLNTRGAREFGVAGPPGEQLKFTARELWLIVRPG